MQTRPARSRRRDAALEQPDSKDKKGAEGVLMVAFEREHLGRPTAYPYIVDPSGMLVERWLAIWSCLFEVVVEDSEKSGGAAEASISCLVSSIRCHPTNQNKQNSYGKHFYLRLSKTLRLILFPVNWEVTCLSEA